MTPLAKTAALLTISALAIGALGACSSSSSTSPSAQTVAGTYVIKQLNVQQAGGKFYVIDGSGDTVIVSADTIVLNANATYTKDALDILRTPTAAPAAIHHMAAGTYTLSDTLVTFTNATTHTTASGKIVNGVLTASDTVNGVALTGVFNKL
jgi:hypothetical protein